LPGIVKESLARLLYSQPKGPEFLPFLLGIVFGIVRERKPGSNWGLDPFMS